MVSRFKQELAKLGETVSYYTHSFEDDRNSTTNRKVSKWAAATDITARVLTQPSSSEEKNEGANTTNSLVFLSDTAMTKYSVIKWANKYYDIILVEEVYWNKVREYYKVTTLQRLEFLGA